MGMKLVSVPAALLLGTVCSVPVNGQDADFAPEVRAACVVEGAAEWRSRMDELKLAEQEIMELERLGCHNLASKKIDDLVESIVADHGIILLDGAGIADGKEAQRDLFNTFLGAGFQLVYEPVDANVSSSGDMAWAIGMVKVTSPDGAVEFSKYVSIWHKIDGDWKNVVEMRNTNGELGSELF